MPYSLRPFLASIPLALLLMAPPALAFDFSALPARVMDANAQGASPQAIAEYRRKLTSALY